MQGLGLRGSRGVNLGTSIAVFMGVPQNSPSSSSK